MGAVEGYGPESYGDAIADVYDEWYPMDAEGEAAVEFLHEMSSGGPVLELGVGTGKLAIPLAERGLDVHGVDASPAMIERLRAKPGGDRVVGDAWATWPSTFRPARSRSSSWRPTRSSACARSTRSRRRSTRSRIGLTADGRFVLDAFVPDDPPRATSVVEVQKVTVDGVILAVTDADIPQQMAWGQFVEIRADGVTLRPWKVRYSTPAELDAMAAAAGLVLVERHSSWGKDPFTEDSVNHVSVYGLAPRGG